MSKTFTRFHQNEAVFIFESDFMSTTGEMSNREKCDSKCRNIENVKNNAGTTLFGVSIKY